MSRAGGMVQAQLPHNWKVQGLIPTIVNKRMNGWLSVHAEIVFSLYSLGTAERLKPGFPSFNPVFPPLSVQEGHQNSVHLRNQFHAALSGACSTADRRSSTKQLTVGCSSTAFRHVSCSHSPKPQTFPTSRRRKSENLRINDKEER